MNEILQKQLDYYLSGDLYATLELIGAVLYLLYVWLVTKNHIASWPVNWVACIVTFAVFGHQGLYNQMFLQVFYFGLGIYGWVQWRSKAEGSTILPITTITANTAMYSGIAWVGIALVLWGLNTAFQSFQPKLIINPWEIVSVAGSLVALYLTAKRIIQNWHLWFLVDAISAVLFYQQGLYIYAIIYAIYLILCFTGYAFWKKEMETAPVTH